MKKSDDDDKDSINNKGVGCKKMLPMVITTEECRIENKIGDSHDTKRRYEVNIKKEKSSNDVIQCPESQPQVLQILTLQRPRGQLEERAVSSQCDTPSPLSPVWPAQH